MLRSNPPASLCISRNHRYSMIASSSNQNDMCPFPGTGFPSLDTTIESLSQPCLPVSNKGPTKILSFLYLGSLDDATNKDLLKAHNITYQLNVSNNCPKPEFVDESHFMRIPVNDNYSDKLIPFFPRAYNFLEKVRQSSECVLVHCLAGISRSATIAIAYVMQHLKMPSEDAYLYVKSKRASISPNFNFLGQLLEYEKQLRREKILEPVSNESGAGSSKLISSYLSQENYCSFAPISSS